MMLSALLGGSTKHSGLLFFWDTVYISSEYCASSRVVTYNELFGDKFDLVIVLGIGQHGVPVRIESSQARTERQTLGHCQVRANGVDGDHE